MAKLQNPGAQYFLYGTGGESPTGYIFKNSYTTRKEEGRTKLQHGVYPFYSCHKILLFSFCSMSNHDKFTLEEILTSLPDGVSLYIKKECIPY